MVCFRNLSARRCVICISSFVCWCGGRAGLIVGIPQSLTLCLRSVPLVGTSGQSLPELNNFPGQPYFYSLRENSAAGTLLSCAAVNGQPVNCTDTTIFATDADGDALTFSLRSTSGSSALILFEINSIGESGAIVPSRGFLRNRLAFDYETMGTTNFFFEVVVRDGPLGATGTCLTELRRGPSHSVCLTAVGQHDAVSHLALPSPRAYMKLTCILP
jgi:hypothetical protein